APPVGDVGVPIRGGDVRHHPRSSSQPAEHVQREGGMGQRAGGELDEHIDVVVARRSVEMDDATAGAAVDEHPFAVAAHGDGERLHGRTAASGTVAGRVVDVSTPQAAGAVVAVGGAHSLDRYVEAAVTAPERARPTRTSAGALMARQGRTSEWQRTVTERSA